MDVTNQIHPDENAYPGKDLRGLVNPGLSVRAEFAKAAMQGLLADPSCGTGHSVAAWAVANADALIEELNKPRKEVK